MAKSYVQTDTAGDCAGVADGAEWRATEGGTAGVTEIQATISAGVTSDAFSFELVLTDSDTWDAGDVVVPTNVTTLSGGATLNSVTVFRYSSGCVSQEQLGQTSPAATLGTGVRTDTVTCSAASAHNAGDKLVAVLNITSTESHGNTKVGVTPDQTIDAPLTAGASSYDVSFAGTVPLQALSAEISHEAPNFDASFAATVPLQTLAADVAFEAAASDDREVSFAATVPLQTLTAEVADTVSDFGVEFAGTVPMQALSAEVEHDDPDFAASFSATIPVQTLDAGLTFEAAASDDRTLAFAASVPLQALVVEMDRTVPNFDGSFAATVPIQGLAVVLGDGTVAVTNCKRTIMGINMGLGM